MEIIVAIVIVAVLAVYPVMFAARMLGAESTTFGTALVAVVASALVQGLAQYFLGAEVIGYVVSFLLSGFVFASVLSTSFFKGLGIAVLALVIQIAFVLVFFSGAGLVLG